jgi:hypothetical protein
MFSKLVKLNLMKFDKHKEVFQEIVCLRGQKTPIIAKCHFVVEYVHQSGSITNLSF